MVRKIRILDNRNKYIDTVHNVKIASKVTGIPIKRIEDICMGRRESARGYRFQFVYLKDGEEDNIEYCDRCGAVLTEHERTHCNRCKLELRDLIVAMGGTEAIREDNTRIVSSMITKYGETIKKHMKGIK